MDDAMRQALASRVSDPLMAALLNSMMDRQPVGTEQASEEERQLAKARAVNRKLREDLDAAERMALYVARVFGACQSCWGLNRLCPQCRGDGGSGWAQPSESELLSWVEPALKRLGLRVERSHEPDGLLEQGSRA
jgi:hypothetical protein